MIRTVERPGRVLATLPGAVHGIVAAGPYKVQCDGCLVVQGGDTKSGGAQIILSDITFNPRLYGHTDNRRLCRDCRTTEWKAS